MNLLLQTCALALMSVSIGQLDTRGLIEQALDEPTQITLENIPLGDAIRAVSQQTGIKIVMPPDVMELVPHGAGTMVREIKIANIPLRQGLIELLQPLGMTFSVHGDHIAVTAKTALRCLGRAATWDELDTLGELAAMQPGIDEDALSRLRTRVQFQVGEPKGWERLTAVIRGVGAGPGDEAAEW